MKKTTITKSILLIFMSISYMNAHAQNYFQKTWGDVPNWAPVCQDLIETSDGFIIAVGEARVIAGQNNMHITKLDQAGDTIWTRTMGQYVEYGLKIIESSDNNYLVLGHIDMSLNGYRQTAVIKMTPDGDILWNLRYAPNNDTYVPYSMAEGSDGSIYLVCGSSRVKILKIDPDGNLIWNIYFGFGAAIDWIWPRDIQMAQDGGIIIIGTASIPGQNEDALLLVKMDSSGTIEWSKTINGGILSKDASLVSTYDGGYVIASATDLYGPAAGQHLLVVKIDGTGVIQWTTVIGKSFTNTHAYDIIENSQHDLLISGQTDIDAILLKLDENGDYLWARKYDHGSIFGKVYSIFETADLSLLLGCELLGTNSGWFYVMKTDSIGKAECSNEQTIFNFTSENPVVNSVDISTTYVGNYQWMTTGFDFNNIVEHSTFSENTICETVSVENMFQDSNVELQVYPNPSNGIFTLDIASSEREKLEIKIFNILGQEVTKIKQHQLTVGKNIIEIDLSGYSKGIYILKTNTKKGFMYAKVMIE